MGPVDSSNPHNRENSSNNVSFLEDEEEQKDRYNLNDYPLTLSEPLYGYSLIEPLVFPSIFPTSLSLILKSGFNYLLRQDLIEIPSKIQQLFTKTFSYSEPSYYEYFSHRHSLLYPLAGVIADKNPELSIIKFGQECLIPYFCGASLAWVNQKLQFFPPILLNILTATSTCLSLFISMSKYDHTENIQTCSEFFGFDAFRCFRSALHGFVTTHIAMQIKKAYRTPPIVSKETLKSKLDKHIIGQDDAKQKIIDSVNLHQVTLGTDFFKPARILLTGPSGSGKTAIVKALSKALEIPMITIDGASLTPEGFVGPSASDILWNATVRGMCNPWNADKCIVFIDEVDKLFKASASKSHGYSDWVRTVQDQLLKIIEGKKFPSFMPFLNSENIIFILGGSFDGLQRANEQGELTTDQLIEFGVSRELCGRLSTVAQVNRMTKEELRQVIKHKRGLCSIYEWQRLFKLYNSELEIDPEVIEAILDFAVKKETGVRGLDSVIQQFLNPHFRKIQDNTASHFYRSRFGFLSNVSASEYSQLKANNKGLQALKKIKLTLEDWKKTELCIRFEKDQQIPSYEDIYEALKKRIIGQEKASKVVADSIYMQQLNIQRNLGLQKGNLLMVGPSGSGKTFMMETLNDELGIPIAIQDASKLTPEGYAGGKIEEVILKLLEKTNGDVKAAERGIIVLDEMDKVFENNKPGSKTSGGQISSRATLNQLLRVIQGDKISVTYKGKEKTVDTTHIQFVLTGSFSGCPSIQEQEHPDEYALLDAGITPEFLGRIGSITKFDPIGEKELRSVLENQEGKGLLLHWKNVFRELGVRLVIEPKVIDEWIEYLVGSQTGIRGLQNLVREQIHPLVAEAQKLAASGKENPVVRVSFEDWKKSPQHQQLESIHSYPSLESLRKSLDQFMVGQDKAKSALSEAIYVQQMNITKGLNLPKGNVLMIGPSGVGKTFMMEIISKEHKIPLGILDASKLTRAGFIGSKPEEALIRLLDSCNGHVRAAEKGIIFLDEIDKIFYDVKNEHSLGGGVQVTGSSVLNQLLKMIQGDKINLNYRGHDLTIDTTNIQFVLAGAFSKSPDLHQKEQLKEEDLFNVGLTPEFLGRIGTITRLQAISSQELKDYLFSEEGIISKWKNAFLDVGAKLIISQEALEEWVKNCSGNQTGFRGLQNLVRDTLTPKLVEAEIKSQNEKAPITIEINP